MVCWGRIGNTAKLTDTQISVMPPIMCGLANLTAKVTGI